MVTLRGHYGSYEWHLSINLFALLALVFFVLALRVDAQENTR
jgi:hypothetical protein